MERFGVSGGQGHQGVPPNIVWIRPGVCRHLLDCSVPSIYGVLYNIQRLAALLLTETSLQSLRSFLSPFHRWGNREVVSKWIVQYHPQLASAESPPPPLSPRSVREKGRDARNSGKFFLSGSGTNHLSLFPSFLITKHTDILGCEACRKDEVSIHNAELI